MKMRCSHCHLEYDISQLECIQENGEELYFCCNGCKSVYFLLQKSGFGGFYQRLGDTTLTPPKLLNENLSHADKNLNNAQSKSFLDSETFLQEHAKKIDSNYEVSLIIEGIHCAACVWLNENIVGAQKGVLKVHINYTNNKAKILFNPSQIKLSQIFALIESIGYHAHIYDPNTQEKHILKQKRSFFISFVVGVFCTMNIMWIAVAQWAGYFSGMSQEMKDVLNLTSCLLATPVLFYTGRIFFSGAYYGLKNGFVGMDLLVTFGASLTFIYSIYASITRSGETYFESVAMIILFVFSGKFLEMRARSAAGDSLDKLHSIIPQIVSVESKEGIIKKDIKQVKIGEIIRVSPGEMLGCDGVLLDEEIMLDMRSLSGESMPIQKHKSQEVLSGSIALDSGFRYEVKKLYKDSMMSHIINLLEESLNHRPHIQNLANSLSQIFSRSVLFIALCGFIGWYLYNHDAQNALIIAISVIVISCPCALALATPIASVVGVSRAYKSALLFKEAKFLESLAKADTIFLDKTGTLTKGAPKLKSTLEFNAFDKNILHSFISFSNHPISKALQNALTYANDKNPESLKSYEIVDFKQHSSRGISAFCKTTQQALFGGSIEFLKSQNIKGLENLDSSNLPQLSLFGYAIDSNLVALFFFEDELKDGAKEFLDFLKSKNKTPILLSGDRLEVVENLANTLGIDTFYAQILPEQKAKIISQYTQTNVPINANQKDSKNTKSLENFKNPQTKNVMIGDGLNDILALQKACVGISMGAGSDVAIACSDVVILDDDSLESLQKAFVISLQTFNRIKQNIALSIIYNALMIPLALAGFIIPLFAAFSMSLSSLLVVGNSLRK